MVGWKDFVIGERRSEGAGLEGEVYNSIAARPVLYGLLLCIAQTVMAKVLKSYPKHCWTLA